MKNQPSIKLTPAQLKMKAVLKPIVEGILNEAGEDSNYYKKELMKVDIASLYSPKIQIHGGESGKTNFINLNSESIPIIIAWLKVIQNKIPK